MGLGFGFWVIGLRFRVEDTGFGVAWGFTSSGFRI
jgi:hypothetical protein